VFITAHKRLEGVEGRLVIVNTDPGIAKVFAITGLDRVFIVVATRAAALSSSSWGCATRRRQRRQNARYPSWVPATCHAPSS
jgi:hypothetical protein